MKKLHPDSEDIVTLLRFCLDKGLLIPDIEYLTGIKENTLRLWVKSGKVWNGTSPELLRNLKKLARNLNQEQSPHFLPYPTAGRGLARREVLQQILKAI